MTLPSHPLKPTARVRLGALLTAIIITATLFHWLATLGHPASTTPAAEARANATTG